MKTNHKIYREGIAFLQPAMGQMRELTFLIVVEKDLLVAYSFHK